MSLTMTGGAFSRRVRVRAATLKWVLEITGFGTADGLVSLTSPLPASDILDHEPFAGRRK